MALVGPDAGARISGIGSAVKAGQSSTLRSAAATAKDIEQAFIGRVAGGDMRLSGVGRGGARVGVRYTVSGNQAVIRGTGPLHLIERNTSSHVIRSKFGKGRRAVIKIPGASKGGYRRYAVHPGTSGQHPFERGMTAARPAVTKIIRTRMNSIIAAAM